MFFENSYYSALFGNNNQKVKAAAKNNLAFLKYFDRLKNIAISVYEWQELPDEIDARFLELTLFECGAALFFKSDDEIVKDFIVARTTLDGRWDIYNRPKERRAYATNGLEWIRNDKNSVIIYNNYLRSPSFADVFSAAEQLAEIDRAIDINAKAQKTPVVIVCDDKTRLSAKNLYQKYDGNEPCIIVDKKSLGGTEIKVLNTGAPYVCDKLYELKTNIWNETLTNLGVPNASYQKKERMLSDEVARLNGGTFASRYSRLLGRQDAARAINKMFDLNISVVYREESGGKNEYDPNAGKITFEEEEDNG